MGSPAGPLLIAVFGVSAGLSGAALPCDPGCDFQTVTGTLHNITGLAGFLAAVVGIFVVSKRMAGDADWRRLHRVAWDASRRSAKTLPESCTWSIIWMVRSTASSPAERLAQLTASVASGRFRRLRRSHHWPRPLPNTY